MWFMIPAAFNPHGKHNLLSLHHHSCYNNLNKFSYLGNNYPEGLVPKLLGARHRCNPPLSLSQLAKQGLRHWAHEHGRK